jgi:hypothetical protein
MRPRLRRISLFNIDFRSISGSGPQVLTVQIKQIERNENTLAVPEDQITKRRSAGFIETANLTIENGALDFQVFRNPGGELGEAMEGVAVSRHQFALALVDMRQCAEAVDLQLVDEQIRVKGSERRESRMGRNFRGSTGELNRET